MKKLLLASKVLLICFGLSFCHSKSKSSGSTSTQSSGKDSVKSGSNTAVNHGAPNQAQLDSMIKAKTNEKNKK